MSDFYCSEMKRRDDISKSDIVKLVRSIALIFFSLAAVAQIRAERPFLGPIPVQYAAADQDLILDMRRFFHPAGSKLEISPNPDVNVAFDAATLQLRVRPKKPGLSDIQLSGEVRRGIPSNGVDPGSYCRDNKLIGSSLSRRSASSGTDTEKNIRSRRVQRLEHGQKPINRA